MTESAAEEIESYLVGQIKNLEILIALNLAKKSPAGVLEACVCQTKLKAHQTVLEDFRGHK